MDYIVHWVAKSQRRLSDFHFTKSIACPPPLIDSQLLSRLGVLMRKEGDVCEGFMPKTFVGLVHISQGLMSCFGNPRLTGALQSRDRERTRGRCAYHDASSARGVGGWVG